MIQYATYFHIEAHGFNLSVCIIRVVVIADGVAYRMVREVLARAASRRTRPSKSADGASDSQLVRIIVADDRRLCRECVKLLIETIDPNLEVVEAVSVDQIPLMLEHETGPSVVLYNLVMADDAGIQFVRTLADSMGDIPLVVMCDDDDSALMRGVLEHGARAFLPSSTPGPLMVAALHLVIEGGVYAPPDMVLGPLSNADETTGRSGTNERREQVIAENFPTLTPRQRHVLTLLSQGMSNRDIAGSLNMRENTVKAHVKQVMRKLRADNRTQAALMADRLVD